MLHLCKGMVRAEGHAQVFCLKIQLYPCIEVRYNRRMVFAALSKQISTALNEEGVLGTRRKMSWVYENRPLSHGLLENFALYQ